MTDPETTTEIDGVTQVDADIAAARVADGAQLLDVREPNEWHAGHAPEAVHVPLGRLAADHADTLDPDRPIVAVCRGGGRSQRAAIALGQAGYDVVNLAGGMHAWAAAGHLVVTDEGDPGQVV